jgi:hypothetical protein
MPVRQRVNHDVSARCQDTASLAKAFRQDKWLEMLHHVQQQNALRTLCRERYPAALGAHAAHGRTSVKAQRLGRDRERAGAEVERDDAASASRRVQSGFSPPRAEIHDNVAAPQAR